MVLWASVERFWNFIVPSPAARYNRIPERGEKTTCTSAPAEVQYPKPKEEKRPSGQVVAASATPGQEGLFDHMFAHRQQKPTHQGV